MQICLVNMQSYYESRMGATFYVAKSTLKYLYFYQALQGISSLSEVMLVSTVLMLFTAKF